MERLLIRVDANSTIGGGHFSRCFSIAEILRDNLEICFLTHSTEPSYLELLEKEGIDFMSLTTPEVKSILEELRPSDMFLVDNYEFLENKSGDSLRDKCKAIICIDDLNIYDLGVYDLIINHNFFAKDEDYSSKYTGKLALGEQFALIRSAFKADIPENKEFVFSFLVTLGTTNNSERLKLVVDTITKKFPKYKIAVVGETGNISKENISGVDFFNGLDAGEMRDLIDNSGIIVCSSGVTLMESFYRNKKIVTGYLVENQKKNAIASSSYEGIENIGDLSKLDGDVLIDALEKQMDQSLDLSKRPKVSQLSSEIKKVFEF